MCSRRAAAVAAQHEACVILPPPPPPPNTPFASPTDEVALVPWIADD